VQFCFWPLCFLPNRFSFSISSIVQALTFMTSCYRIALTPGEPAGIGPDLVITLAQQSADKQTHEIVAIADPDLLRARRNWVYRSSCAKLI
jgi:hypothetical protein